MLTGENGILKQATNAKNATDKSEFEEQVSLAVIAAKTNKTGSINTSDLETELNKISGAEITKSENNELPWTVKKENYVYIIGEDGGVKEKEGIAIITGNIEILEGITEEKKIRAEILNDEIGIIKWECTGNITLSATEGSEVTVKINSNAKAGDTAIITAKIEGKTYQDSINVIIVAEATGLTASKVTVGVNEKGKIGEVTTIPENAEGIEITSYVSQDITKATVKETTGEVMGVATGTTKVIITGIGKLSKKQLIGECEVEVTKQLVSVTVEQIAANPKAYYGKKVENYKASEDDTNTYRIFYIDTEDYFRDGANTLYLKADYIENYSLISYAKYDSINTKVRTMNPLWGANRTTESRWNINEQAAAYLCSPVNNTTYETTTLPWKKYYNKNIANVNYVIGGPSIEMYVKSYNQTHDQDSNGNDSLGCQHQWDYTSGYGYKVFGDIKDSGWSTNKDTLDYSNTYNSMYCGKNGNKTGYWWLASPSAEISTSMCIVFGNGASLDNYYYGSYLGLCPLVSLKPDFLVQIEE